MTIYRRRVEFQMLHSVSGTLSDDELKLLLMSMRKEHPSMGQAMVWGRLRSTGFSVTREKVRQAIRHTDQLYMLERRCYQTAALFCARPQLLMACRYVY